MRPLTPKGVREPDADVDEFARIVIDAALEVHKTLGPGQAEHVYESALAVELGLRSVPVQTQVPVSVMYKGIEVGIGGLWGLLVGHSLVVELWRRRWGF